jgi:PBSX family phage terminase large subunit
MSEYYINKKLLEAWNQNKRFTVAYGGRGSSKSMGMGALCILFSLIHKKSRILCVRGTQNKISESSLQVLKDVINMMGIGSYFIETENTLRGINGSEFLFYGAVSYHSFKSLQGIDLCWVDEATELKSAAWDILIPSIRDDESRFLISFNPDKAEDWVYKNFVLDNYINSVIVKINYPDNDFFPKELMEICRYEQESNYQKYLHIWEGELNIIPEGALWNYDMFRIGSMEDYDKIIIALDPSGSSKTTSDACGIIVTAKKGDNYYILEDATAIMSPREWGSKAIALYHIYKADYIVYESNYGGDMIPTIIHQLDANIPCKEVRASRGKLIRAEPIVALYEAEKVYHVKKFVDLEYEYCFYVGDGKSPNRLDAAVWGLSSLSEVKKKVNVQKNMAIRF